MISSCKKIKKLTNFYAEFTNIIVIDPDQQINSTTNIWSYYIPDVSKDLFHEYDSKYQSTQSIMVSGFSISMVEPEELNLDIIESVNVFLVSGDSDKKKIAWLDKMPEPGLTFARLNISRDELKDLIIGHEHLLYFQITTNSSLTSACSIDFDYNFYIGTIIEDF